MKVPVRKRSEAEVFIIESLKFYDENKKWFDGKFVSDILRMRGKKPKYYYIRTKKELKAVLGKFLNSGYRYLHLSCHGTSRSIDTTLDSIPFTRLKGLLQPYLRGKRLFMSTCYSVNRNLAEILIPSSGCLSIIGPVKTIEFPDAAIFWASFFHLVFKEDPRKMARVNISQTLQKVVDTVGISLNYFSISKRYGFKGDLIIPGKKSVRTYP